MKRVDAPILDELWQHLPSHIAYPDYGEIKQLAANPAIAKLRALELAPESRKAVQRLMDVIQKMAAPTTQRSTSASDHDILRNSLIEKLRAHCARVSHASGLLADIDGSLRCEGMIAMGYCGAERVRCMDCPYKVK